MFSSTGGRTHIHIHTRTHTHTHINTHHGYRHAHITLTNTPHTHTQTHTHTHTHTQTRTHTHMQTHTHTHTHKYTHTHTHTDTHTRAHTHQNTKSHSRAHTHTHTHTHKHTHTLTHTHTHTHSKSPSAPPLRRASHGRVPIPGHSIPSQSAALPGHTVGPLWTHGAKTDCIWRQIKSNSDNIECKVVGAYKLSGGGGMGWGGAGVGLARYTSRLRILWTHGATTDCIRRQADPTWSWRVRVLVLASNGYVRKECLWCKRRAMTDCI
jgi:hypothetical protein